MSRHDSFRHPTPDRARRSAAAGALLVLAVWALACLIGPLLARAEVIDHKAGAWSGGAGAGFLADTPDGAAEFALKGHADYFLSPQLSVGPLAQYAGAGNDFLFGLSAQVKYWWDIRGTRNPARLVVQDGLGFVRAGIKDTDSGVADTFTSFLIPIGVGVDYALTRQMALTAEVVVNFTSLGEDVRVGGREVDLHTNVMPGLYLGVRF